MKKNDPDELFPTRLSLIGRLKNWEDTESWRVFFNTYWRLIYGVAVKSGLNDAEAQDVVQETVIAVAKKMEDFKYDPALDSFKGWLLYLTRKRIAMSFRRRKRDRLVESSSGSDFDAVFDIEQIPDPAGINLEAIWEEEWDSHVLDAAVARVKDRVNPKQFQMFSFYVLKQWPVKEVAEALDVPVAQVYLAKHRISALVQQEVKQLRAGRC